MFFVSVCGKDPSVDFIKRLDDIPRTIKKLSDAELADFSRTPEDRSTGKTGVIFSACVIRWLDSDKAEVKGGYDCGLLCAAETTFAVQREDGKWKIKKSLKGWIS